MSTINTNGINSNYPVPGVNNNSQGFRDNFTAIVTNLNVAATEITDLQNKVVVKQALTGTVTNNDMANTLISNASTRSFRATTYNLGNALSGSVAINAALGDVHYGTIAGNTTLSFGSWAPTGTQSNVQLLLSVSNANAVISFPSASVIMNGNTGVTTLENFANIANIPTVTVPNGVTQLNYIISTTDCGNTLYITPTNRPRITTAIQQRSPIPTGFKGDVAGDTAVDANYIYVCTGTYDASTVVKTGVVATYAGNLINCTSTTSLVVNAPIIFTGTSFGGIAANTTYYVKTIPDGANITISATGFDGVAGNAVSLSAATGNMAATSYNGSTIWKRVDLAANNGNDTVTGNLTVLGNLVSSGAITSNNTGGVGYTTGAGGAVTQLISRTTGVTINKTTGAITLFSAAGSTAYQTFTVTNSTVAATDVIVVNQKSGTDKYLTTVSNVAASSFSITFATTGGTTTEQPVFNFAVIKGAVA